MTEQETQISDSMQLAVVLALSGGLMDAYTYLYRGEVFANAQTGNILLMGVHLAEGEWTAAVRYMFPVLAFAGGIVIAEILRYVWKPERRLHWRQLAVLLEALILLAVGFLGTEWDALANALVSLACGIQVEGFRKVEGNPSATTMCIGNLRTGTQAICDFFLGNVFHRHKKGALKRGAIYYGIILAFVAGAVLGKEAIKLLGAGAIWGSSVLLAIGFVMMYFQPYADKETE